MTAGEQNKYLTPTRQLMNGRDLYTLKEILGHKELDTTARYLTVTTAHKVKAMEIFQVPEIESNIIELKQKAV